MKLILTIKHNGDRADSVEEYTTFEAWHARLAGLQDFLKGAGQSSIKEIITTVQ